MARKELPVAAAIRSYEAVTSHNVKPEAEGSRALIAITKRQPLKTACWSELQNVQIRDTAVVNCSYGLQ
jgi:hypothetical protein